jgi:acyl-CoA thioesterase YciA
MSDTPTPQTGRGEPAIRSVPMPSDANSNGDIFGGWVLSQMDIAGGTIAARYARGRVVTVAVDAMTFHRPIQIGDLVSIYGKVSRLGRTSITIDLETVVERQLEPGEIKVTEGKYIFVAIDANGDPRAIASDTS